jgi:hypothetical protein
VERIPLRHSIYPETEVLFSEFFIAFLHKKLSKYSYLAVMVWPGLEQAAIGRIRGFCE